MRTFARCVFLSVTLIALTSILAAAEQNADQLRQEGKELRNKAERLQAEGKIGEAEEVARKAEEVFRRADEVAGQRGPQERRQKGPVAVKEFIGRQMEALERYVNDLRGQGKGSQAEQLQRDVSQLRESLERIERDLREGRPGMPGPGPNQMGPGFGPQQQGGPGMPGGGPGMPPGFQGCLQAGGPEEVAGRHASRVPDRRKMEWEVVSCGRTSGHASGVPGSPRAAGMSPVPGPQQQGGPGMPGGGPGMPPGFQGRRKGSRGCLRFPGLSSKVVPECRVAGRACLRGSRDRLGSRGCLRVPGLSSRVVPECQVAGRACLVGLPECPGDHRGCRRGARSGEALSREWIRCSKRFVTSARPPTA